MKLDARLPNQPAMSYEEIWDILKNISLGTELYKSPRFRLDKSGNGYLLQLVYSEKDCTKPDEGEVAQFARKWYVSAHSTPTEVIRTAYKAVLTSLEHRLGEWFTYKGVRVMSPHRSLDGPGYIKIPNCS